VSQKNFILQVQGENGYPFPIYDEWKDEFPDFDAAELQAMALSKLPRILVKGWGGRVHTMNREVESFEIVIVNVSRWCVVGAVKDGVPA